MIRTYPALQSCKICPHKCGVNRYETTGFCRADHRLKIDLAQLHHGEEPVLSGNNGSGTIFLSHCNLRCCFCQNHQISQLGWGSFHTEEECAALMLKLQEEGAHNINLVSPTHYSLQLISALDIARQQGLSIPIVWNSNAYESVETLKRLKGLVDIYLPDFKYAHAVYAQKYSSAPEYPTIALAALKEMHSQVSNLLLDAAGIAVKGVIVRHLVLPHRLSGSREVLYLLHETFGADLALSLLAQYYPAGIAETIPELSRGLNSTEYQEVLGTALALGFRQVFTQELSSSADWTPDFNVKGEALVAENLHFRGTENHA